MAVEGVRGDAWGWFEGGCRRIWSIL